MAKIKFYAAMPSDMMSTAGGVLLDHDDTSAEFTTRAIGDTVVLKGSGFSYDNDALVGGTASEFVYRAGGSADYYRVTNFEWVISQDSSVPADGTAFLAGNDVLVGSQSRDYMRAGAGKDNVRAGNGDDVIFSGEGNDTLKGGGGSDTFVFALGDGKDRILDFDTHGPIQDVISMANPSAIKNIEIYERFNNVFIEYGKGDVIILKNVDLDDLSHKNFSSLRHFDFDFG